MFYQNENCYQPYSSSIHSTLLTHHVIIGFSYKINQLDELSNGGHEDKVTVYKMGTHVDLISGPLIPNANLLGRYNVTAVSIIPYVLTVYTLTYSSLNCYHQSILFIHV